MAKKDKRQDAYRCQRRTLEWQCPFRRTPNSAYCPGHKGEAFNYRAFVEYQAEHGVDYPCGAPGDTVRLFRPKGYPHAPHDRERLAGQRSTPPLNAAKYRAWWDAVEAGDTPGALDASADIAAFEARGAKHLKGAVQRHRAQLTPAPAAKHPRCLIDEASDPAWPAALRPTRDAVPFEADYIVDPKAEAFQRRNYAGLGTDNDPDPDDPE